MFQEEFDEWEARRVIRRYNLLRLKTGLPPISVKEIDRMRDAMTMAKVDSNSSFTGPHCATA